MNETSLTKQSSNFNRNKKQLFLLDGYGFIFRAYHSVPPFIRPDGLVVGAVYGYANMLIKLLSEMKCDYFAVILDHGSDSFRKKIYPQYKANRPPAPEDLIPQFALVKEFTLKMNLPAIDVEGFEADDIIATYVKQAKAQNIAVTIISSDKDLMQLIDDDVRLYDPMKNKYIGKEEVFEKFGVFPDKIVDLLAMMGDSSDNVPGIPSIGPKTAAELLKQYGSLDKIIENVHLIKQEKRKEVILNNTAQAYLSKELVTLYQDIDLQDKITDFSLKPAKYGEIIEFVKQQNFKSLLTKIENLLSKNQLDKDLIILNENYDNVKQEKEDVVLDKQVYIIPDVTIIKTIEEYSKIKEELQKSSTISFELDFTNDLIFVSNRNKNYQIVISAHSQINGDTNKTPDLFGDNNQHTIINIKELNKGNITNWNIAFAMIEEILLDDSIKKISYDVKTWLKNLHGKKINIDKLLKLSEVTEDIMLMSYVAQNGKTTSHKLEDIFFEYLWLSKDEIVWNLKSAYLLAVYELLFEIIQDNKNNNIYYLMEKPLIKVLFMMEMAGIKISESILRNLSEEFSLTIKNLENEIYQIAGSNDFSVASPKQLGELLFDKLNLKADVKKSKKSDSYSTSQEVLEELSEQGFIIADKILEWRHFTKLKNTYTDSLIELRNHVNNRIYTNYNNATTITGRLSSTNPNLQNIPTRSLEGQKIRQAFVPEHNHKFISADYSQIELRILAEFAGIEQLKYAFLNNEDIHTRTASEIFNVELNKVDKELRRKAKAINFGIIYRISSFGLAKNLNISKEEAKKYMDMYFERYPKIKDYMANIVDYARKHGFVETILGRKCYITNINHKNFLYRNIAERTSINAPIQGSAADIIKLAMIDINNEIIKQKLKTKMLLQIHDELVFEVPFDEVELVEKLVKNRMQNVVKLSIPLIVDTKIKDNLSDIK